MKDLLNKRITLLLFLLISAVSFAQEKPLTLQEKLAQQKQKYQNFKQSYLSKYEKYRQEIKEKWGVAELSSQTEYIDYNETSNTKVVTDFENDTIEVNILETSPASQAELDTLIRTALLQSLNVTPKQVAKKVVTNTQEKPQQVAVPKKNNRQIENTPPAKAKAVVAAVPPNKATTTIDKPAQALVKEVNDINADKAEVSKVVTHKEAVISSDSVLKQLGVTTTAQLDELVAAVQFVPEKQQQDIVIARTEKRLQKQITQLENYSSRESVDKAKREQSKKMIVSMNKERNNIKKDANALTHKNIKTYRVSLKRDRAKKATPYLGDVNQNAAKWQLSQPTILAIMETESHFNPLAQSYIPAYGLMQIVPSTAGQDVNNKILGINDKPTPQTLLEEQSNIEYGSAYLHLLMSRYLKEITDPTKRLYCAIAAYNTGVGNLARAFNQGKKGRLQAIEKINNMTTEEVYNVIKKRTHTETQRYIDKVLASQAYFKQHMVTL